jgi:hypothetical protein
MESEPMTRKEVRNAALREARQAALAHSNYGALSGNRRAFKIASAIDALMAKEDD